MATWDEILTGAQGAAKDVSGIVTVVGTAAGGIQSVLRPTLGPAVQQPVQVAQQSAAAQSQEAQPKIEDVEMENFWKKWSEKIGLPVWSVMTILILGAVVLVLGVVWLFRKIF